MRTARFHDFQNIFGGPSAHPRGMKWCRLLAQCVHLVGNSGKRGGLAYIMENFRVGVEVPTQSGQYFEVVVKIF